MLKLFVYGNIGFLLEVWFTGIWSVLHKNPKAMSTTFLWSALVYGLAGLQLEALHGLIHINAFAMAAIYTTVVYANEFVWGWFFDRVYPKRRLWDYGKGKHTIMGYITFHYLPFWYGLTLTLEWWFDRMIVWFGE